jgi:hypothetical protein
LYRYSPEIIEALKDALRSIYWYKRQLRAFLLNCKVSSNIVQEQRWEDPQEYKIIIIENVINKLMNMGDRGLEALRELTTRIINIEDFSYLLKENDGRKLKKEAEVSVERLRQLVNKQLEKDKKEKESIQNRKEAAELRAKTLSKTQTFDNLRQQFFKLFSISNFQQRGRELEKLLYDLFNAHDLYPRGPFSLIGEQIDGSFELDGDFFLLEAKWENKPIGAREIRSFKEQVESKLDNTLGLFISVNGFTDEGIIAVQKSRPNLILMSGEDLTAVFEARIDLRELLRQKLRHAAQTGEIYRSYNAFL